MKITIDLGNDPEVTSSAAIASLLVGIARSFNAVVVVHDAPTTFRVRERPHASIVDLNRQPEDTYAEVMLRDESDPIGPGATFLADVARSVLAIQSKGDFKNAIGENEVNQILVSLDGYAPRDDDDRFVRDQIMGVFEKIRQQIVKANENGDEVYYSLVADGDSSQATAATA